MIGAPVVFNVPPSMLTTNSTAVGVVASSIPFCPSAIEMAKLSSSSSMMATATESSICKKLASESPLALILM